MECNDGASELNIEFTLMFYHERSPFSQRSCNDGASELNIEFTLMFYHERSPFSQTECKGTTFLTNNYKK